MKFVSRTTYLSLFCFLTAPVMSTWVFVDMGFILEQSTTAALKHISIWDSAQFTLSTGHKPNKYELFDLLKQGETSPEYVTYNDNIQMPTIALPWLLGSKSLHQVKQETIAHLHSLNLSKIEKKVYESILEMMFTPEKFTSIQSVKKSSAAFLKALKQYGYKLALVTNWDKESFPVLRKKLPKLFDLFDEIIISGDCGSVKPYAQLYEHACKACSCNPEDCINLEVEEQFVEPARKAGLTTHKVHAKKPDFKALKKIFLT